jgi:hypothetical protein
MIPRLATLATPVTRFTKKYLTAGQALAAFAPSFLPAPVLRYR